jgi:ketosteroid isomerase-like protein
MSQENVELVLGANAAANGGDYAGAASAWHPDAELRDRAHAVDSDETVRGRDAILALWSQWRETFDEFRAEIQETVDCGTHIVCATRWVGRGSASGAAVDVSQVDVYEIRDGKIVRVTLAYPDQATALEAVRLSEA